MTRHDEPSLESLPPDVGQRIDVACERFEDAWQSGSSPRIEEFVTEPDGSGRAALVRELVLLDVRYRRRSGEFPSPGDYATLFPDGPPPWLTRAAIDRAGRYRLVREVGQGGMGVIFQVYDPDLGREIAVKVLHEADRENPAARERFLREVRVTARLQHPNIPAVHEQGELADGRPFFAMKLIRGGTLDTALGGRAAGDELPRYLRVFLQVCQGVAFAHSLGVIHRDLKPQNVMVGEFGEVQVMDWGIAKVLGERPRSVEAAAARVGDPDDPLATGAWGQSTESTGGETRPGDVMGTLAYLPPEQARGEVGSLDQRSDVFSLGAILCEILVGSPPYTGASPTEMLAKAKTADLSDAWARLDGCGADSELVALCKDCLAADLNPRPRDAGDVASRVAAYQAAVENRLRSAERERAAVEAKGAEQRKRRKVQLALASVVVGAGCVIAVAGLYWQHQQALREQNLALAGADLRSAEDLLRAGHIADARAPITRADGRLGPEAPDRSRYRELDRAWQLATELERVQIDRTTPTREGLFDNDTAQRSYEQTFVGANLDLDNGSISDLVKAINDSPVRAKIVEAIDNWALVCTYDARFHPVDRVRHETRRDRLLELGRQLDPDPDLRDLIRTPRLWDDRQRLELLAQRALRNNELSPRLAAFLAELLRWAGSDPELLLRAFQARHRGDFWLNWDLAKHLQGRKPAEALRCFQAALAVHPRHPFVLAQMGSLHRQVNDIPAAIAAFEEVLASNPDFDFVRVRLGDALRAAKRVDEAVEQYRRSAAGVYSRSPFLALSLGEVLEDQQRLPEAIEQYRVAAERISELNPAQLYYVNGKETPRAGLEAAYRTSLGKALAGNNEVNAAIQEYRKAIGLWPAFAPAHFELGVALQSTGDLKGAAHHFREAARHDPSSDEAHHKLGHVLMQRNDPAGAVLAFRAAVAANKDAPEAHYQLAGVLRKREEVEEAIEHYRHAVRLSPATASFHQDLGETLRQRGQFAEALMYIKRAQALSAETPGGQRHPESWLRDAERSVELERKLPDILAGRVQSTDATETFFLGETCHFKNWHADAARFYYAALLKRPELTNHHSAQRLRAACSAVLAAGSQVTGAELRGQALSWLRHDLAAWQREVRNPNSHAELIQKLGRWQGTRGLANVRDAIPKLPQPEQEPWQRFWAEVGSLRKQAQDK
jgi:eukaryotic-like serine/threonine-protein kinase